MPTALAYKGNFFVGNLGTFPVMPGTQSVFKLTPSGQLKPWATGLTTVLGLAFDRRHRMYVLETSNAPGPPSPGTGDIVRIEPSGAQTTIVSGLTFPTGMTMGRGRRTLGLQPRLRAANPWIRPDPANRPELEGSGVAWTGWRDPFD